MGTLKEGNYLVGIYVKDVVLRPDGSGSAVVSDVGNPYSGHPSNITGNGPNYVYELNDTGPRPGLYQIPITTSMPGQDPSIVYDSSDAVLINYNQDPDYYHDHPTYQLVESTSLAPGTVVNFTAVQGDYVTACYAQGTRIATSEGPVPIEALSEGDLIATISGNFEPVTWIGRRTSRLAEFPPAHHVDFWPILIRAGSLGLEQPSRDLFVSPCHGMFVDGVMMAAWRLVNDATIVRATWVTEVTYYHVELARHCIIFAEGALGESHYEFEDYHLRFDNGSSYPASQGSTPQRIGKRYTAMVSDIIGTAPSILPAPVLGVL